MNLTLEIPWERYGLIAEIVNRFNEPHRRLGKTVLQKLIFVLQRVYGVDCDYSYTLHTYGPYCAQVARDLDVVESFGGATVINGPLGYAIQLGPVNAELRQQAAPFLTAIERTLDLVMEEFGGFNAKEMELRSTIIYLERAGQPQQELVEVVHQVKPHFTPAQIASAINELASKGLFERQTVAAS